MKRLIALMLGLVIALSLSACGGGNQSASPSPAEPPSGAKEGWSDADLVSPGDTESPAEAAKMIYTAQIELETLAFDKAVEDITALVDGASGYYEEQTISSYSSHYRHASFVVRVPSEKFAAFCRQVGDVCHTLRLNTVQENVSESYYDTESRLNTARTKLGRLQELLSQAQDLKDIITIEDAISETEQTIDRLTGALRSYDNLVDYATVRISLEEVYHLTGTQDAPLTLGQRIGNAFKDGLSSVGDFFEGLVVFLAFAWLWLLMLAVVIAVVVMLLRKRVPRRRRRGKSGDAPAQE